MSRFESEWQHVREDSLRLADERINAIASGFRTHRHKRLAEDPDIAGLVASNPLFASWYRQNTRSHKVSGYRIVFLSRKSHGQASGDISGAQMQQVAQLADDCSFSEIRTTYSQNLIFAHVEQSRLFPFWQALASLGLANPDMDTANDIICCPCIDFCSLANATSIDVAQDINRRSIACLRWGTSESIYRAV